MLRKVKQFSLALAVLLACSNHAALAEDSSGDEPFRLDGKKNVLEIGPEVLDQLSDEERQWYQHFQEGILFFDGWVEISEEILAVFPDDQRERLQRMMQRIGIKIGTEWAKDNTVRKIDNNMLKQWGDRLKETRQKGPVRTLAVLEAIESEVDLILLQQGRLSEVSRES